MRYSIVVNVFIRFLVRAVLPAFFLSTGLFAGYGREEIEAAIRATNVDLLDTMGLLSANFEQEDERGYTMLMVACEVGGDRAVEKLLEHGANRNVYAKDGMSPFTLLVARGRNDLAWKLMDKKGDPNLRNFAGQSLLQLCVRFYWNEGVKILLARGARVTEEDRASNSAMVYAVKMRNLEALKMFFYKGYKISSDERDESTMLFDAVKADQLDMVRILLENGVQIKPHQITGFGKGRDRPDPAFLVASKPRIDMLTLLARYGSDLHAVNGKKNTTLLMAAARAGMTTNMWFLMTNGVDVNAVDGDGNTALSYAVMGGQLEAVKLLLTNGIDIGIENRDFKTALDLANEAFDNGVYLAILQLYPDASKITRLAASNAAVLHAIYLSNALDPSSAVPAPTNIARIPVSAAPGRFSFTPEFQGTRFGPAPTTNR